MTRGALALLFLAACGSSAPDLGGDVVGSWRQIPFATLPDNQNPATFEFAADGTWSGDGFDGRAGFHEGTYSVADDKITFDEAGAVLIYPYAVHGTDLFVPVLIPDDDGADVLATWTGSYGNGQGETEVSITFSTDMNVHLMNTRSDGVIENYQGTWRQIGETIETTFDISGNVSVVNETLRDGFLGTAFEKI